MRLFRGVLPAFLVSLSVSGLGCRQQTQPDHVQKQWVETMRELGIVPVFPPREDLVVGDVYFYEIDPDGMEARALYDKPWRDLSESDQRLRARLGMGTRVSRVDLSWEVFHEYSGTLSAPATPTGYNSILGNPALVAAQGAVDAAKEKLGKFKEEIAALEKKVADCADGLKKAQRSKEDAARKVEACKKELEAAKGKVVSTVDAEKKLEEAKRALLLAKEKELDAICAAESLPSGASDALKEQARQTQLTATTMKKKCELAVECAREQLDARQKSAPDAGTAKDELASAEKALREAEDGLVAPQRAKEDAEAKLTKARQENEEKLKAAQDALTKAEGIRDAIAKAGVQMLYAQPRDGKKDIFIGGYLSPPGEAEDPKNSRVNRLRLVAFPEFASVRYTGGDLDAMVPIEAFSPSLRLSGRDISSISVSVPAAESYGLSLDRILPRVVEGSGHGPFLVKRSLWGGTAMALLKARQKDESVKAPGVVYLRVVTEVFYARALDISISSERGFGGGAGLEIAGLPKLESAATGGGSGADSGGETAESGILRELKSQVGKTRSLPGGSIEVVSHGADSVGLRRVFDRPVAIGCKALVLGVDPESGQVVQVAASGGLAEPVKAQRDGPRNDGTK